MSAHSSQHTCVALTQTRISPLTECSSLDASSGGGCVSKRGGLAMVCWRVVCDVMLVTFIISTVLGVVHNSNQPKIRAAFRPRPFVVGRHVKDYYQGNVFQAFQDAAQFENSLLMFYAPWDRESQEARSVLLELGEFFSETDILIAAVNCWYPTSDCAKEFGGKASGNRYPVFIYYPARLKGIQYRGPVRSDHLIDWVRRCRYPLTPVLDLQHFRSLHSSHTNLLVGFLPALATNSLDTNLVPLLQCSHHLLETDPATRVLVTSDPALARSLHLHVNHPLRLFSWNSSLTFPNKTVEGARCGLWTLRRVSRPAGWLQLPGRKSVELSRRLGHHSLLVFSPRATLTDSYVEMAVTEVAARYSDCNSSSSTAELVAGLRAKLSAGCPSQLVTHHCLLHNNVTAHCLPAVEPSGDQEVDYLLYEAEAERRHQAQYETEREDWAVPADLEDTDPVRGLGCRDNTSLNILLVDTAPGGHSLLADSLGLSLSQLPALALVSVAEETVSVLSPAGGNITDRMEAALLSWHSGQTRPTGGQRSSERSSRLQLGRDSVESGAAGSVSSIREVTRDNFEADVVNSKQSTVLLYTSSYCSQCSVTAHLLHSVNRILAGLPDIQFRMVDTSRNDLNWQFTALAYPSVIFFPGKRKENSRVFPTYKELNSTSLLNFILSNLSPEQRLRLALQSCDNNCVARLKLHATQKLSSLQAFIKRRSRSLTNTRMGNVLVKQIRHVR